VHSEPIYSGKVDAVDLRNVAVFVEAAQSGSLAAAARRLGVAAMVASRRLAALEAEVGARLIHRTTVSSALTPEGEQFLPFAQGMLETEAEARQSLAPSSAGVSGLLRITAAVAFSRKVLVPMIPPVMERNPALRIELVMADGLLDLVALGIDLALRIAPLRDSNLIARKVGDNPRALYATPSYLAKNGIPTKVADLGDYQCLAFPQVTHWSFVNEGRSTRVKIGGRFTANAMEGLHDACLADLGIAMLSDWHVRDAVASGRLVAITLSDGMPETLPIWAVYPSARMVPPKVRAFLHALGGVLRTPA
jgi:DNA-binding transcriptional LysR family regulator